MSPHIWDGQGQKTVSQDGETLTSVGSAAGNGSHFLLVVLGIFEVPLT